VIVNVCEVTVDNGVPEISPVVELNVRPGILEMSGEIV
jgi:hypothetical protein